MKIGEEFLGEVGLASMDEREKQEFLEYIQEELEVRVGEGIAEGMTEEKMREFQATETDEAAKAWLEKNRPVYREVVRQTIREFKDELRRNREKILR